MYTVECHHMGDAWYFVEGDTVHMFYITAKIAGQNSALDECGISPVFGHAVLGSTRSRRMLSLG